MGDYISCVEENGTINIAEDVISGIVKSAVCDVEGVAGLSNAVGAEIAEFIGIKTASKGIKIQFSDGKAVIDVIITILYGFNIVDTAKSVQSNVISAVSAASGIDDITVNVHVSGISFENNNQKGQNR